MAPVANMISQPSSSEIPSDATPGIPDPDLQRRIAESASLLLDPALLQDNACSLQNLEATLQFSPPAQAFVQEHESQRNLGADALEQAEYQAQPALSCVEPDAKLTPGAINARENFDRPASSLVSPPASLHDAEARSSPEAGKSQWTPSRSPSEQSFEQHKQVQQRYTPDSGSMRRNSNSPYGEVAPQKDTPPQTADRPSSSKSTTRLSSDYIADEESLKLIKELQAQELGLRRRGKA